jgi:selenocysteine-specific elongation factor
MHIVGTAGHVDHGKSSLVTALTGTNPDRWAQEQARGMTLDLGFAHLCLEGGIEAGIVDVPGHERFLHNMLAGAAGMDLLLLVIAANEGIMPQTVEHLHILSYLNVRRTIVVLTKADLLSAAEMERTREAIVQRLRGTIAQDAPCAWVSSLTGAGLPELRALIAQTLGTLPPRERSAPLYLPIDRVFTLPGLGTVVTGTLMQGSIGTGETLWLQPSGAVARVRSLHVFGKARERADAGSRVALNLPSIDRHAIVRGEVAVNQEFEARSRLRVRFTPLDVAVALLRRRNPVRAYIGSAEILGTLVLDDVPAGVREVRAELHLRCGTVAFPGVRFVLRRLSPKTLLGGGFVEGAEVESAPSGADSAEAAVASVLRRRGMQGSAPRDIAEAANLREDAAVRALDALVAREEALKLRRPVEYVDATAARELFARVVDALEAGQRAQPWALGATSLALSRATGCQEALLVRVLAEYAEQGKLANRAGYYATPDYQPVLCAEQRALFDELVAIDASQPLLPVAFERVLAGVKQSRIPGVSAALDTLLATGALVKVGDDCYRGSQIARIRARVEEYLRRHQRMTAAEFRDLLGTSRKYAVPLLEWLDAHGVTLRSGDYRVLRKRSAS